MALSRITDDTTLAWLTFFNDIHLPEIEALAGGGNSDALAAFLMQGRFPTDADGNAIAPEATATPALAIVLPAGLRLILDDGTLHTLAAGETLTDAPAGSETWPTVAVAYDENSETYTYTPTWNLTRPALGSGVLAKVTTDADSATLDTSEDESDVILPLPSLLARLRTAESGGGGGGGFTYPGQAPYLPAPGDDRALAIFLEERFAQIEAYAESLAAEGGRRPMQTKDDVMAHELAIIRQEVIKLKKLAGLRSQSANILLADDETMYGTGLGGTPDHLGPTTLTENADGTFEP